MEWRTSQFPIDLDFFQLSLKQYFVLSIPQHDDHFPFTLLTQLELIDEELVS